MSTICANCRKYTQVTMGKRCFIDAELVESETRQDGTKAYVYTGTPAINPCPHYQGVL